MKTKYLLPILLLLTGCSVAKYVPEGEQFYAGVKAIHYEDKHNDSHARAAKSDLEKVLSYKPNGSLFNSSKVRIPITFPFWISQNFAEADTFIGRWLYKSFGADPLFISTVNPTLRATVGTQVLEEYGYFRSDVRSTVLPIGKDSISAKVRYDILMGDPHLLDSIEYHIPIITSDSIRFDDPEERLLHKGEPFGVVPLENERSRISALLRDRGYYFFKPEHIRYVADTLRVPGKVQLRVGLSEEMLPEAYQPWRIGQITYDLYPSSGGRELTDSLEYEGVRVRFHGTPPVRLGTLRPRVRMIQDALYNQAYQQNTLTALAELNTFAYTNISYTPGILGADSVNHLNVHISSTIDKPYFTELEAVYKFKSNNQTGPGAAFTLNRKNILGGGELLSTVLRGSYEWETHRQAGQSRRNTWDINSYELSLSTMLTFPELLIPGLYRRYLYFPSSTRIALSGTVLNRSDFYRQAQFATDLTYRLEPRSHIRHTIKPLSVTYNHLLRETDRFKEAIGKNPGLALSFQNQFIPQASYLFSYELNRPMSNHAFSLDAYVSEAGNVLSLFYKKDPALEYQNNRFLKALFAQFVKGYLELRYSYQILPALQIATRGYAGAVYSYGNTQVAPYTEQFYTGGANSLRGFNVRSIGPGSYLPQTDDPLAFLYRTGDLRLELNAELRYKVIGQMELATFIDTGNIWLLKPSDLRPDGELNKKYFFQDLALNTGLGLRYDLNFLVVRLDLGLALHRPDRHGTKYFNTFGKDQLPFALHLAIGYPF